MQPPGVRALVIVHVVLVGAFALIALLDPPAQGWAVLGCVVLYNVALPLTARAVNRPDVLALWAFLLPVSLFQLLPDWVLAAQVGTLRFPDTGGIRVADTIPVAMAGMWVAPLLITVLVAGESAWRAAVAALVLFAGAEFAAPVLAVWEPTTAASQVGGVALYVLPAEAALGAATLVAWRWARDRTRLEQVGAALGVATFYLGALALAHFLLDQATYSISV
ncbi:hypothetical protein [Nocardioides sp.]|uniref:DUF6989 domain-containing protein n=1 Tax=Nocardioides sp. TaxID=35761 RepID=UPI00356228CC